jgi:hypothetical protein
MLNSDRMEINVMADFLEFVPTAIFSRWFKMLNRQSITNDEKCHTWNRLPWLFNNDAAICGEENRPSLRVDMIVFM